MKSNIKYNFLGVLLLLISTSCADSDKDQKSSEKKSSSDKIQKVEVVNPQHRDFTAEVLITGSAKPNQMVTLYAMESGMLKTLRKDIGDKVKKGETLAVLENPELKQQQMKWQAEIKAKKSNYDRLYSVYQKTPALTNIQMVENAEADYLKAKANLDAIKNRIGFLVVKAPFSGIITKRFVDQGAMIQNALKEDSPQAIFEIQEIDPIRLTIPVPEADAIAIKKGMEVEVTLPELSENSFMAKVSRASNALDMMSKTMHVEIDIDNPDGRILSGMYARALVKLKSRDNILSLPIISKISHKNEDYILAVVDGKVRRILIEKGLSNQNYFEVLNDEVTAETKVIVKGKSLVKPNQIVEPILKQD